jgi:hypothetical protein
MRQTILRLLLAVLACAAFAEARAEDAPKAVPEFIMKAAYLYNFAQLTEWPDGGNETFNLCVYGTYEIDAALEALRGKTINRRPLRLVRVTDAAEAQQCQLLFVGEGESGPGSRLFGKLQGTPVLTVTDDPRMNRSAAMLILFPEARRLAFEASVDLAKRSRLKFSSKLLGLARRVIQEQ